MVAGSIFLGLGQIVDAPGIGEIAKPELVASAHLGVFYLHRDRSCRDQLRFLCLILVLR